MALFRMKEINHKTGHVTIGLACISKVRMTLVSLLAIRTPEEEPKPVERFGEQCQNYLATTERFFPRISTSKEAKPE